MPDALSHSIFSEWDPSWGPLGFVVAVFVAVCISEDLTLVGIGMLVARGSVDLIWGIAVCVLAILVTDLGLWAIGRFVRNSAEGMGPLRTRIPRRRLEQVNRWYDRHGALAVMLARATPGLRMPMYVLAGAAGVPFELFFICTLGTSLIWGALLVILSAQFGDRVVYPIIRFLGGGGVMLVTIIALAYGVHRLIAACRSRQKESQA